MSTCLIITQGDKMYIGADSACSVKTPDGFRRYSDDMQKLFRLNEQIFFCSGNMSKVYECVDWIYNHFTHSICIEDLQSYLVNNYNNSTNKYYDIEILITDYKENVVYQLSQYNNFEILTYPYSEQLRVICGGYKTKDAFIMTKKNILLKQSIHNIYHNTYQDIADECVGGYLYLYSSPTDFRKVKIIEDNIKYVCQDNELHLLTSEFVTSGFINGTQIIGGYIYSQNYSSTTGTYFDLYNGHFSLGGGALAWDGTTLSISSPDIPTTAQITQITKDTITTSYIKALNLTVGNEIQMGENATISWKQINDADSQVTTITNNTIATTNVVAENLQVKAANIDGILTASQIESGTILAGSVAAENIIGTTISGKIISGGTISGTTINNGNGTFKVTSTGALTSSNATITGGSLTVSDSDGTVKVADGKILFSDNDGDSAYIRASGGSLSIRSSDSSHTITLRNSETNYIHINDTWGAIVGGGIFSLDGINTGKDGTTIKLIKGGYTVTTGDGTSKQIVTDSTISSWYSGYNNDNCIVLIANGWGEKCTTHYNAATWHSGAWYATFAESIATSTTLQITYIVICW